MKFLFQQLFFLLSCAVIGVMSSDSFFLPGVGIPSVRRGDYIDGTLGVLGAGNIAIHGDKSGKHEVILSVS